MQPHKRETWDVEYGELIEDVRMSYYRGYWDDAGPSMDEYDVPAGTTVRIVMVSRFGDVGITEKLQNSTGYGIRLDISKLANLRKVL
jgi:hypothetical protein